MPEILIQPAVVDDVPQLLTLERYYQTGYVWQIFRSDDENQVGVAFRQVRLPREVKVEYPRSPAQIEREWAQNMHLSAVLLGEAVGYIGVREDGDSRMAWVTDLVVAESVRRQGIATALLLAAQDWAVGRGLRGMVTVAQSKNYPAIRLALKLGYEFSGYHDHYYANQEIALFFARNLR